MDPITLRWIERLLIVGGGIVFGCLGYKLFIFGVKEGTTKVSAQSKLFKVVFSGTAPGLFFMAAGCGILISALVLRMETVPSRIVRQKASSNATNSEYLSAAEFDRLMEEHISYKLAVNPAAWGELVDTNATTVYWLSDPKGEGSEIRDAR